MTTAVQPGSIPTFDKHDRASKALTVAGVRNKDMAEYVGCAPETMSRYLSGKSVIPVGVTRLIALRTGIPFEWIENGDTTKPAPSPDGDGAGGCAIRDLNPEPADSWPVLVSAA